VLRCQKLTHDGLTWSGTGCFIAVPIWQQWASKGLHVVYNMLGGSLLEGSGPCQLHIMTQFIIIIIISVMHHYYWIAPNVDISLQSGQFSTMSFAAFRERLLDVRSWWIVFIHVVWGRPGGLFQFSKGAAVEIFLASVLSVISAVGPNSYSNTYEL